MTAAATGFLLREVTRRYSLAQRAVAGACGSTAMQCHLLCELARTGPLSVGALGQRLGFEKSWISRSVDRASIAGLVAKSRDPSDGRGVLVRLTVAGRARARTISEALAGHADRLLARLPAAGRTGLGESLAALLCALNEDDAPASATQSARGQPRRRTARAAAQPAP
jgi:DNA-binding MarR family transcriptional regulator